MKINYYEPSENLKKYIRCYWSACEEDSFAVLPIFILGTGNELIINLAEPFELKSLEESLIIRDSGLMKIRKNPVKINRSGKFEIFSIRFRAGAFYSFCKENIGAIKKELFVLMKFLLIYLFLKRFVNLFHLKIKKSILLKKY